MRPHRGDDAAVIAAGEDDHLRGIEQSLCGGLLVNGVGGDRTTRLPQPHLVRGDHVSRSSWMSVHETSGVHRLKKIYCRDIGDAMTAEHTMDLRTVVIEPNEVRGHPLHHCVVDHDE